MDIIQEKPCTHLRIYSTEFKIFILMIVFVQSILKRIKICVSSAQTFTRHAETVTTQGTWMRLWKMHWRASGLFFETSCPPWHARHPWQEFSPHTSVFWRLQKTRLEGMDREAQKSFQGIKQNSQRGSACGNAALCTCGRTVSVQGSEKMPGWVLKEKGGTLNPEKSEFLCLTGVLNIHTQSKRGSCAHPPRGLHHFSEHREYKTSFQKKKTTTTITKQKHRIQTFGWSVFRNRRKKS